MEWDFVITVPGGASENCPAFLGKVKRRLHRGLIRSKISAKILFSPGIVYFHIRCFRYR